MAATLWPKETIGQRLARWPIAILTALDRLINALVLFGDDRETISGRAWFAEQDGERWGKIARPATDWLFSWHEAEHCRKSAEWDAAVRQLSQVKLGSSDLNS